MPSLWVSRAAPDDLHAFAVFLQLVKQLIVELSAIVGLQDLRWPKDWQWPDVQLQTTKQFYTRLVTKQGDSLHILLEH